MKIQTRRGMLLFIREFLSLSLEQGKCLQGCGRKLKRGQVHFCSDVCRHLYNIYTHGQGRPQEDLTEICKASLRLARKGVR